MHNWSYRKLIYFQNDIDTAPCAYDEQFGRQHMPPSRSLMAL